VWVGYGWASADWALVAPNALAVAVGAVTVTVGLLLRRREGRHTYPGDHRARAAPAAAAAVTGRVAVGVGHDGVVDVAGQARRDVVEVESDALVGQVRRGEPARIASSSCWWTAACSVRMVRQSSAV
jgi:hypothetical protein